jgi:hypothetical protein
VLLFSLLLFASQRIRYRRFPAVERFFQRGLFGGELLDFFLGVEDDVSPLGADRAATIRARRFAHFYYTILLSR